MAEEAGPSGEGDSEGLPDSIRGHAVGLASDALGELRDAFVPAQLRKVRQFDPRRRAARGQREIAAVIAANADFRDRVAEWLRDSRPELAAGVSKAASAVGDQSEPEGVVRRIAQATGLSAADITAAAYFLRPEGWEVLLHAEPDAPSPDEATGRNRHIERTRELEDRFGRESARLRRETDRLRSARDSARTDADRLRAEVGQLRVRTRRAEAEAERALADAAAERTRLDADITALRTELAAARRRTSDLEARLLAGRRTADELRRDLDTRAWLLLEAAYEAVGGLRRELGLPAVTTRPADAVARAFESPVTGGGSLTTYEPPMLLGLLGAPRAHLIVDGYNVTKPAYGELTLEEQRRRLVAGLAALAARTGAEVTCVFDGQSDMGPTWAAPRSTRVIFSQGEEIADQVIAQLVEREPQGRIVLVVSSDREVADDARRHGFHAVPSASLRALLERG